MSLYGTPSAYQPNSAAPWASGIRTIGSALAMRPIYEARARQQAALAEQQQTRAQLEQAQIGETQAKTRLTNAQADEATGDNLNDTQLANALKKLTTNPNDTDAQGDAIAGFGRAYKKNPEGTAKALGQLFAQFQARTGGTNFANMGALQGDAAQVAGQTKPTILQPGAAAFDAAGNKLFGNPSAAAQVDHMAEPDKLELQSLFKQSAEVDKGINDNAASPDATTARALMNQRDRIAQRIAEIRGGGKPLSGIVQPAPAATNAPAQTGGVQSFNSEQEARAAGFQSGQTVRLIGVGVVRLR